MKAHSEAFSAYNFLRYSKRTMCKALHEKILHILIAGRLLKDAYVVVKVYDSALQILGFIVPLYIINFFFFFSQITFYQDNAEFISQRAIKKFATAFTKLGNINLINDVLKVIHGSGYKIDQVGSYGL